MESFLPNLVLFVAGQAAAWFYLRTGRLWIGAGAMAWLWIAADWAVLAKYVFAATDTHFRLSLLAMQLGAVVTVAALGIAWWRRRWSKTAKARGELFARGLEFYLGGDHEQARLTFRRLVRSDPWDAAAWLALGNTLRRLGRDAAARRCYRRCRHVDLGSEYADLAKAMSGAAVVGVEVEDARSLADGSSPAAPSRPRTAQS